MSERERAWRLQSQGRLAEAETAYRRLVEADPADFESWNNLGNVHRAAGRAGDAVAALERAATLRPDVPMVRLNLAGALAEAGRIDESAAAAALAVEAAPDDVACRVEHSRALARLGDDRAALGEMARAAALMPGHAAIRVELGLLHAALGELGEAEAAYREAIRLQPGFAAAFFYLGILLEHANRADELEALLAESSAQRVPAEAMALVRAYKLRREGDAEGALAAARASPAQIEPLRRAQLIGETAERTGDADAAFAAFAEMNRLAAASLPAPRDMAAAYRSEIEVLLALTTAEWRAGWTPAAPPPDGRESPVFLVGFPRSGTTLLDTALMGHDGLHVVEEKPLIQPVLDALGGDMGRLAALDAAGVAGLRDLYFRTLDALDPPPPGRRIVDKMPLNIARLPILHRLFPDAPVVFALRHPCDVVLSCWSTGFGLNYAMANFLDLGDAARLYDLIMRYWERCREVFPLRVHEIRYEAMVEDMAGTLRPLVDFLGLEWRPGLADHRAAAAARGYVASASFAQVTEPVYRRSTGRWRRYRAQMEPVLPLLAPWAERFGYEI